MESKWDTGPNPDSAAARASLDNVDHAREYVADRIRAPWWYHVGMGLAVGIMFASFGVGTVGVVIGGILLPAALMWLATRATGVRIDRYRIPSGAGRAKLLYMALFILAIGGGVVADVGWGVAWVMPVVGAVMVLPTILVSYRLEQAYQREVQARR